jgi:hypothetical protein
MNEEFESIEIWELINQIENDGFINGILIA